VHYSGFNTDLSTPASVDDQINTNDYSVTDPVIKKKDLVMSFVNVCTVHK
jgi:hypothetical protein